MIYKGDVGPDVGQIMSLQCVEVVIPDLTCPSGATAPRLARVQFQHSDNFERAYSWRRKPPVIRYCIRYEDNGELAMWVDARYLRDASK